MRMHPLISVEVMRDQEAELRRMSEDRRRHLARKAAMEPHTVPVAPRPRLRTVPNCSVW
jgi:hypothetical protein